MHGWLVMFGKASSFIVTNLRTDPQFFNLFLSFKVHFAAVKSTLCHGRWRGEERRFPCICKHLSAMYRNTLKVLLAAKPHTA